MLPAGPALCGTHGTITSHNIGHFILATMNKCTVLRRYAFPNPCVIVLFSCCDMYYHLSQYWSLFILATMKKCTELRKCAFSDPCLLDFFFLVLVGTATYQHIRNLLTPCIVVFYFFLVQICVIIQRKILLITRDLLMQGLFLLNVYVVRYILLRCVNHPPHSR